MSCLAVNQVDPLFSLCPPKKGRKKYVQKWTTFVRSFWIVYRGWCFRLSFNPVSLVIYKVDRRGILVWGWVAIQFHTFMGNNSKLVIHLFCIKLSCLHCLLCGGCKTWTRKNSLYLWRYIFEFIARVCSIVS